MLVDVRLTREELYSLIIEAARVLENYESNGRDEHDALAQLERLLLPSDDRSPSLPPTAIADRPPSLPPTAIADRMQPPQTPTDDATDDAGDKDDDSA